MEAPTFRIEILIRPVPGDGLTLPELERLLEVLHRHGYHPEDPKPAQ